MCIRDSPRRKQVAAQTALGALKLSQIKPGEDPGSDQVPLRHLAMLAQVRSGDQEVWSSLVRSGHIEGLPSESLKTRLGKMRDWIASDHFPDEHRIHISTKIPDAILTDLSSSQKDFLLSLSVSLEACEWSEPEINSALLRTMDDSELSRKECYSLVYKALIGRDRGPKVSTLITECDRSSMVNLLNSI